MSLIPAEKKPKNSSSDSDDTMCLIPAEKKRKNSSSDSDDTMSLIPAEKKSKNSSSDSDDTQERCVLPFDIITDILSRLSVKLLLRFRCVCKKWNSLTYAPHFIQAQLKKGPSRRTIYPKLACSEDIWFKDLTKGGTKLVRSSYDIEPEDSMGFEISNVVDGLACAYELYDDGGLYLLNPFTREMAEIPPTDKRDYWVFGFGYDASTGAYKLLMLYNTTVDESVVKFCEIITLGTDQEWRDLGELPAPVELQDPVYRNGTLYLKGDDRKDIVIYAFDFKEERFVTMPGPNPKVDLSYFDVCLKDMGGRLCVILAHFKKPLLAIWTVKDYATCEWMQLYNVEIPRVFLKRMFITPVLDVDVLGLEDEKIILATAEWKSSQKIVSYDVRGKKFYLLSVEENHSSNLFLRSESLLSPRKMIGDEDDL